MCEISIIDPSANDVSRLVDVTEAMYKRNNDGVGLIGVYSQGDEFRYTEYKSVDFDENAIAGFFGGNKEAWRVVVHCRLATAGGVSREATHPLQVQCSECDGRKVVHNGIVAGHQSWQQSLEAEGHHFNTEVDSEVIAHSIGELPRTMDGLVEEDFGLTGSLNFLVFGPDRILVRSGYKYQDRPESFLMGRPVRCAWDGTKRRQWMLVHPDRAVETMDASTQSRWSSRRTGSSSVGSSSGVYGRRNSDGTPGLDDDDEEDEESEEEVVEEDPLDGVEWDQDWLWRYAEAMQEGEEDEFNEIVDEHAEEDVETAESD